MKRHHPALSREFLALILWLCFCAHESLCALEQSPSATSENTKFTPPPGKETDAVEKLIDRAKISLQSGQSTTSILTDPAFLSVHEWPRFRQLIRESAQGSPLTI